MIEPGACLVLQCLAAGDSRAVLCRANKAVQLTDDHKPEREDEAVSWRSVGGALFVPLSGWARSTCRHLLLRSLRCLRCLLHHAPPPRFLQERVEKAGGQVLFWNGHRVMGVLAMSRAIGDHGLRPYIIPEPEVGTADNRLLRCKSAIAR